jgi:hypothetical protein
MVGGSIVRPPTHAGSNPLLIQPDVPEERQLHSDIAFQPRLFCAQFEMITHLDINRILIVENLCLLLRLVAVFVFRLRDHLKHQIIQLFEATPSRSFAGEKVRLRWVSEHAGLHKLWTEGGLLYSPPLR